MFCNSKTILPLFLLLSSSHLGSCSSNIRHRELGSSASIDVEGLEVDILGRSGKMRIERGNSNVQITFDALRELDSEGNIVGKQGKDKHSINNFAQVDFSFEATTDGYSLYDIPLQAFLDLDSRGMTPSMMSNLTDFILGNWTDDMYYIDGNSTVLPMIADYMVDFSAPLNETIEELEGEIMEAMDQVSAKGSLIDFSTSLSTGSKLRIQGIAVSQPGLAGDLGKSWFVNPGDFKFNFKFEDWQWCVSCKDGVGAFVELDIEIKGNKENIDEAADSTYSYELGESTYLELENKFTASDGTLHEMPSGYPRVTRSGSKTLFTFRFPKIDDGSIDISYDPLIRYTESKEDVTSSPTQSPTFAPTNQPTFAPTAKPTSSPSLSQKPSPSPTHPPTYSEFNSHSPSISPAPSKSPTNSPTTSSPTNKSTLAPTIQVTSSATEGSIDGTTSESEDEGSTWVISSAESATSAGSQKDLSVSFILSVFGLAMYQIF